MQRCHVMLHDRGRRVLPRRSDRETAPEHAADSRPAQAGAMDARGNAPHRNDVRSGDRMAASSRVLKYSNYSVECEEKITLLALVEWRFS